MAKVMPLRLFKVDGTSFLVIYQKHACSCHSLKINPLMLALSLYKAVKEQFRNDDETTCQRLSADTARQTNYNR